MFTQVDLKVSRGESLCLPGPNGCGKTMLLDSLGLRRHLRYRNYTRLSGGETQLVMILRALVHETPGIVMD